MCSLPALVCAAVAVIVVIATAGGEQFLTKLSVDLGGHGVIMTVWVFSAVVYIGVRSEPDLMETDNPS
ncbi:hypothetical protein ACFV23_35405 [Streptomyces sp. NPDC059627]